MSFEGYKVVKISPRRTYPFLKTIHYALRIPSISYAFGLIDTDLNLKGICTFGTPCCKAFNNLNWKFLELNRLALIDNKKNESSFLISASLKLLPKPLVIVSWSDMKMGHLGVIYQASNWIYSGESAEGFEYLINGKSYHPRTVIAKFGTVKKEILKKSGLTSEKIITEIKHRYFYPLAISKKQKKEMINWVSEHFGIFPYPKGPKTTYNIQELIEVNPNRKKGKLL